MICQRCLLRLPPRPAFRTFSTTTRLPLPANPPAATSTSSAQPFSTPFTPSPARNPEYKEAVSKSSPSDSTGRPTKQATPTEPKSSVKAGTVLRGLGYIKGKEAPIAKEDHEYPDWLWGLLDGAKGGGKEGVEEGDALAKSKKQRRIAAKAERKALKANPSLAFAAPKIPLEQQSIDLPAAPPSADDSSETEAQRTAREAREGLTGAMRKSRRKSIKEGNFLKSMR